MIDEHSSRFCKEPGCLEKIDIEPDKSYDSVMYKTKDFLNFFYPSKKCGHGYCRYHARRIYYEKFFKNSPRGKREI